MEHMIRIHKVKHHIPDNCDYCMMKFSSNQELIDHAQLDELIKASGPILVNSVIIAENSTEEEGTTYHCTICDNKFTSETEMDSHIDMVHKTIPQNHLKNTGNLKKEGGSQYKFQCIACKFTTTNDRSMRMHKKAIHSETQKPYKCEQCNTTLRNKGELLKHTKTKHQDVKCIICGFTAVSPSYLKSHIKRKHNKDTYQCDECQENMKSKISLINHKRKHLVTFKCNMCDFKGVTTNALSYHTTEMHDKDKSTIPGLKREASIKVIKDSKKSKKGPSPRKKEQLNQSTNQSEVIGSEAWSLKKKDVENQTKITSKVVTTNTTSNTPNIKELFKKSSAIPVVCKPHLPGDYEDAFLHNVIGDGACFIRCMLAHLGINEEEVDNHSKSHVYVQKSK